jgi:hypothetical protein
MNATGPVESRSNQKMERNTRGFLKGLNSGERTLPKRLSPKSARDLLVEARRMRWILLVLLSFGCSISSAQIEPNAGKWKTWVLTSSDQLRLPPPTSNRCVICYDPSLVVPSAWRADMQIGLLLF